MGELRNGFNSIEEVAEKGSNRGASKKQSASGKQLRKSYGSRMPASIVTTVSLSPTVNSKT